MKISRRTLIATGGGVAAVAAASMLGSAGAFVAAGEEVPADFDHVILGVNDLEHGIAFVEERTGVRAVFGGVHPGRGTQNALLALGERRYLEIAAPDPKQATVVRPLQELREPRLLGWAMHTDDIAALAKRLTDAGFAGNGPMDGSRVRPDGKTLRWKSFNLKESQHGLLPFFIEWSRESVHPAVDAPHGCRLVQLAATSARPDEVAAACRKLGLELMVERGEKAQLRARIAGPKGEIELTS